MKTFTEYLTESKKTYDFKIKIAGQAPEKCVAKIKEALAMYDVASCSAGKRTPIQETHFDFPDHKNVEVTVFEVCLNYPVTSAQIRAAVANGCNKAENEIRVRNPQEEAETILNHANDQKSEKSLLDLDYESSDNQKLVGDKHVMSMLKELTKNKKEQEQVKGTNDELLATNAPTGKGV
jgi:hypothetical protein